MIAPNIARWTRDARQHGKTPTLAYFQARGRQERADKVRRLALRILERGIVRMLSRAVAEMQDRRILYGTAGTKADALLDSLAGAMPGFTSAAHQAAESMRALEATYYKARRS